MSHQRSPNLASHDGDLSDEFSQLSLENSSIVSSLGGDEQMSHQGSPNLASHDEENEESSILSLENASIVSSLERDDRMSSYSTNSSAGLSLENLSSYDSEFSSYRTDSSLQMSIANPSMRSTQSSLSNEEFSSYLTDSSLQMFIANPSMRSTQSSLRNEDQIFILVDGRSVDVEETDYKNIQPQLSDEDDECINDYREETRKKSVNPRDVRPNTETRLKLVDTRMVGPVTSLSLREYQKELAKPALKGRNTIICAPTGSGKTRVALEIMIKHLKGGQGVMGRERKVCFFACTVPLAIQQYKTIRKYMPQEYKDKIQIFTGCSPDNMSMPLHLPDLDVVVVTPMVLLNHINGKKIKDLSVFSLLIFDECHHTREGEPYNILMSLYMEQKLSGELDLPQIVGLTASFPMENAIDLMMAEKSILHLCANLDVTSIPTVVTNEEELKRTVPVPTEKFKELQETYHDESYRKIVNVMKNLEKEAQECAQGIFQDKISSLLAKIPENKKLQSYINWAVDLRKEAEKIPRTRDETFMPARCLMIISKYLEKYHVALELHDLVHIRDVVIFMEESFDSFRDSDGMTDRETRYYNYFKEIKKICKTEFSKKTNPNLIHLGKVIEELLLQKGPSSRGIVFVKSRAIAVGVASWLNHCENKQIEALDAGVFTGTNVKESQGGMTQKQQTELVQKFKEGKVRLLVATSVAEEGIDVPECNLVINYNRIGNVVTTIQTRGRSRMKGGHSVLMALPETEMFRKEMLNRKQAELMKDGIESVSKKKKDELRKILTEIQREDAEERKLKKQQEEEKKGKERNKKFEMFCKLCRNFCVEGKDIRLLCGNSRIVINKSVLDRNDVHSIKPKVIDDIHFVGGVKCGAILPEGKKCNGPLGSLILYKNERFLALGIKNFMIEEDGSNEPRSYKQWKRVPYPIDELSAADVKNNTAKCSVGTGSESKHRLFKAPMYKLKTNRELSPHARAPKPNVYQPTTRETLDQEFKASSYLSGTRARPQTSMSQLHSYEGGARSPFYTDFQDSSDRQSSLDSGDSSVSSYMSSIHHQTFRKEFM